MGEKKGVFWGEYTGTSLVVQWLEFTLQCKGVGSISGHATKIPHTAGQLSLCTTTRESPWAPMKIHQQPKKRKKNKQTHNTLQHRGGTKGVFVMSNLNIINMNNRS